MENVPQIVSQRLKAAPPAINHPDADVLTAFTEQALPERERAQVLDHLARCVDCRDVVALALPASESVEPIVSPSRSGWLTWPTLRWGFAAAGVIVIASLGILQYQRHLQPGMMAYKESAPQATVKVAKNEPVPATGAGAVSEEKGSKLQVPVAPAFTDALDTNVANEKKSMARAETQQPRELPAAAGASPQTSQHLVAGSLPHGPRLANQWQQTSALQNQAPVPAAPQAFRKQQAAGDLSANVTSPAISQNMGAAASAPQLEAQTQDAQLRNLPSPTPASNQNYAYPGVARAKPPVPQAVAGQLGGYVVDPSGAVIPNARITIIPSMTGGATTAVTDSKGEWLIAGLPTGSYKAQAAATGFKTTVLDLNYDANQPSSYSFTLSPGSVSETVEVSSAQAQITNPRAVPLNGQTGGQLAARLSKPLPRWSIDAAGSLQRSLDQGNSWQAVDVAANSGYSQGATSLEVTTKPSRAKAKDENKALKREAASITFRALAASGSEVWAGGSAAALYHSTDGGNHWSRVLPAASGSVLTGDILSLDFPDVQHGRISTSNGEVWTTNDDGQTWQKQ